MMNSPSKHPLFQKLLGLKLPGDDFIVFGSAPMWLHGLKDEIDDIDLLAQGLAWKRAAELAAPQKSEIVGEVIRLFDGKIELFDTWAPGEWSVTELRARAVVVDGLPFASLQDVAGWKEMRGSEKDQKHIELVREYLSKE